MTTKERNAAEWIECSAHVYFRVPGIAQGYLLRYHYSGMQPKFEVFENHPFDTRDEVFNRKPVLSEHTDLYLGLGLIHYACERLKN